MLGMACIHADTQSRIYFLMQGGGEVILYFSTTSKTKRTVVVVQCWAHEAVRNGCVWMGEVLCASA